ncbi:MAG: methyltransferase domain-containing protein [Coxiellaceae bacterium]|nr:methyltransferase domain-containing protein [Coxiellaceae bacterium]
MGIKKDLDKMFDTFLPLQKDRVKKIKPYLKPEHTALEIGSNTGYFLHVIKPLVSEIQGQELNVAVAQYAAEVRGIPTSPAPIEQNELPEHQFDHICLFQLLEHAVNPIGVLDGLKRLLKPGGKYT